MKKLFILIAMALSTSLAVAQNSIFTVSVYADCSKNGYTKLLSKNATVAVNSGTGRTSCDVVQLWENGPYWATFNVGATITDYANLTIGADATSFYDYTDQAPYYNTANVGGLYPWNNPNLNGRKTTWTNTVSTGISDVATTLWGSNWETPTKEQLETLQSYSNGKTTWVWCDGSTTQYIAGCTLKGYKVSGVGDYANYSIFLPVAGFFYHSYGAIRESSSSCYYWSSTENGSGNAYDLLFGFHNRFINFDVRYYGLSVRAVLSDNASIIESPENPTLTLYADGCSAPNVITCQKGQQIRINAVETYGCHFTCWNDGNTTNPRVVTVNSNATYTAQFAKNLYTITTTANDSARGIVKGDTIVEYLDSISISAITNYGYHFTQWNDGNTNNPRQVQVTEDKTYTAQFDKNTYYITKISNTTFGQVSGSSSALYLDEVTLSATANDGCHFSKWSDGNTDNPRSFVITQDTTFEAQFVMKYSGQCGDNLHWKYNNEILTISGTGDMYDTEIAPWILFRDSITSIVLPNGLTSIGYGGAFEECKHLVNIDIPASVCKINDYAFYNCEQLNSITLPVSLTTLGYSAFAGCRKLYDVYCLSSEPPVAQSSSFENYNVYLHVPCDNKRAYDLDAVFGSFKYVVCISAEEVSTTEVITTPTDNSVTITWPTTTGADSYTIVINKGGEPFCTLNFNANGQLTNIAFAPGRGISNNASAVELAGGYKFTVTSLSPNTKYNYEIDTKNAGGTSLANYTGTFTTTGGTALDQISFPSGEDRGEACKIIKDDRLLILRDGKTYNAQGTEVR